jgi:UDP-galactopyranose mutase
MPDKAKIEDELRGRKDVEGAKDLEDYWIRSVGETLYKKYIDQYSKKMWLVDDNKSIDTFNWSPKGVALKEGPRAAWDTAISGYPYALDGYNSYFDLSTSETKVLFSTTVEQYDIPNKRVKIKGEWATYDIIVNTIPPDALFDYAYGELPFIGRDFHKIVLPMEFCFPEHVYFLYYANDEQFTRLVEYKKFSHHKSPTTIIGMEIPSLNGKHYPLPIKSEIEKSKKYFNEMPQGVFSIGRAGSYRYDVDIDDCIAQAMEVADQLK